MKSRLLILCIIVSVASSGLSQQASSVARAKVELSDALAALNRPSLSGSDEEHPGWREPNDVARLRAIADRYPNTDESRTALLWIATVDIENAQTNTQRLAIKERATNIIASLDAVIQKSPASWQARAARLKKCHMLFLARDWPRLEQQATEVVNNTTQYTQERAAGYIEMLEAHKLSLSNIEPELRHMLVIAASFQGRLDEALQRAEYLQQQFPQWSQKARINSVIATLKEGKSPFRLPYL